VYTSTKAEHNDTRSAQQHSSNSLFPGQPG